MNGEFAEALLDRILEQSQTEFPLDNWMTIRWENIYNQLQLYPMQVFE